MATHFSITIPKKGNAKECWNNHTIALISHTSNVMLRILQARLQQCSCLENPRDGGASWLLSMASHRIGHDRSNLAAAAVAGFSSMWTKNLQMIKLDLEKAEKSEIKLPTSVGSQKKYENPRKTPTSTSLTMLKFLRVWITTNCGKLFKRWEYHTILLPPVKSLCRSRSNS